MCVCVTRQSGRRHVVCDDIIQCPRNIAKLYLFWFFPNPALKNEQHTVRENIDRLVACRFCFFYVLLRLEYKIQNPNGTINYGMIGAKPRFSFYTKDERFTLRKFQTDFHSERPLLTAIRKPFNDSKITKNPQCPMYFRHLVTYQPKSYCFEVFRGRLLSFVYTRCDQ